MTQRTDMSLPLRFSMIYFPKNVTLDMEAVSVFCNKIHGL